MIMVVRDLETIGRRIDADKQLLAAVIGIESSETVARDWKGEIIDSGSDFGEVATSAAYDAYGHGSVGVLPGSFESASEVVIRDDMAKTFIGSGVGKTVIDTTSDMTSKYIFSAPNELGSYYADGVEIAHMSLLSDYGGGIYAWGFPAAPSRMKYFYNLHDLVITHENVPGIYIGNIYGCDIRRCDVSGDVERLTWNMRLRSIYRFEIDRCFVHGAGYDAINCEHYSSRGVISNCEISDWNRWGMYITDHCSAVHVRDCRLIENRDGGSAIGILISAGCEDIFVSNSEIEVNTNMMGIYVGGEAASPTSKIHILSNNINGCANVVSDYVFYISGYCEDVIIKGNACDAVPRVSNGGTNTIIEGNINYNPRGNLTPPAANPANGTTYTNTYCCPCLVTISGGTVTEITVAGQATGLTSGAFVLAPGQTIVVTQSSNPTWLWIGL